MVRITEQLLRELGGHAVFNRAREVYRSGRVTSAVWEPPFLKGFVGAGRRGFRAVLKIDENGDCENHCTCPEARQWGQICEHVLAVGIAVMGGAAQDRVGRGAGGTSGVGVRGGESVVPSKPKPWSRRVLSGPALEGAQRRLELSIILPPGAVQGLQRDRLMVTIETELMGKRYLLQAVPPSAQPYVVDEATERMLQFIEKLTGGEVHGSLMLGRKQTAEMLSLIAAGGARVRIGRNAELEFQDWPVTGRLYLRIELGKALGRLWWEPVWTGRWAEDCDRSVLATKGHAWAWSGNTVAALRPLLPDGWEDLFFKVREMEGPDLPRFLREDLPRLAEICEVDSDPPLEQFEVRTGSPAFSISLDGHKGRLVAQLEVAYGIRRFTLDGRSGDPKELVPDPERPGAWNVRDLDQEADALARVNHLGLNDRLEDGRWRVVGEERVLNCLGSGLPLFRRLGWRILVSERLRSFLDQMEEMVLSIKFQAAQGKSVGSDEGSSGGGFRLGSGQDWLQMDLAFRGERQGERFSMAQVMEALACGRSYLTSANGRVVLFDENAVDGVRDLLAESGARADPGSGGLYRVKGVHGLYLDSALEDLPAVRVEGGARPSVILSAGRGAEVPLRPELEKVLRAYQREGYSWLARLRARGLGGVLADEMGLGKTVQVLAVLDSAYARAAGRSERNDRAAAPLRPSLVVCPTSLVRNWAREAERFAPELRVLVWHGPKRGEQAESLGQVDLIITSYALLRRDLNTLLEHEFEFLVLDEAQHIKNPDTHNARSARALRAQTRYVLTGTPVENTAGDLWSMMDFSLPGYLGSYKEFRERYELPMRTLGSEERGELGRRLGRRVRPFLLRRKKVDVLKDLPPKLEQISSCVLSSEQEELYRKLLDSSRKEVFDSVLSKGMGASRMVILTALMRLRQVCCHPALLPIEGVSEETPSGKMELFSEILDETLDSGHRVLVFSQFVQMLKILRSHLKARDIRYCYLDGSTRDRLGEVDRFNGDATIPVFLISLKAGGTGLNLASADTVIHFDPWWNPAVEDQATDRAHRIGQRRTVHSIRLVTEGTVEEKIMELQQRKRALAEVLVEEGTGSPMDLSMEDLERLLGMD